LPPLARAHAKAEPVRADAERRGRHLFEPVKKAKYHLGAPRIA
jgi:hypothetical protein